MTKRIVQSRRSSLLSAQNTISIGSAIAILGGCLWLAWQARGYVNDLETVKQATSVVQSLVNDVADMKRTLDRIENGRELTKKSR